MSDPVAAYLARNEELVPLLRQARDFYVSHGRFGGTIEVTDTLEGVLGGILGRSVAPGQRVEVARLDRRLRRSGLACSVEDLVVAQFGALPPTRAALSVAGADRRLAFWERVERTVAALPQGARGAAAEWVRGDREYLVQAWEQEGPGTEQDLAAVLGAAARLPEPGGEVPLSVFASRVTGDPHAFDADRRAGRFLARVAEFRTRDEPLGDVPVAEARLTRFLRVGIVAGSMASTVLVYGLLGEPAWLSPMRDAGDEMWLPLTTVARYRDYRGYRGIAFAVENQHVFLELRNRANGLPPERRPTLLCTSGAPCVAAHLLLRALVHGGCRIRYSGDFEWKGLDIAHRLRERYAGAVQLWRMEREDYEGTVRPGARSPDPRIASLRGAFPELVPAVERQGVAFQEELIDALWDDINAEAGS